MNQPRYKLQWWPSRPTMPDVWVLTDEDVPAGKEVDYYANLDIFVFNVKMVNKVQFIGSILTQPKMMEHAKFLKRKLVEYGYGMGIEIKEIQAPKKEPKPLKLLVKP